MTRLPYFRRRPRVTLAVTGLVMAAGCWSAGTAASSAAGRASPAPVLSASIDPAPGQAITGFGVSGAWWPADLAKFPSSARQQLDSLLFTPSGLDVSQYRYLIGSGGVGVIRSNRFKTAPSYLRAHGAYDWNADPAGLAFLQAAAHDGVPDLVAFVNAAPAVLNPNRKSCDLTLGPSEVGRYARYLTTVLGHLIQDDHLPIGYLSPMNEPTNAHPACDQEGMRVTPQIQGRLIPALARDLAAAHLPVGLIANESDNNRDFWSTLDQWFPAARSHLAALADHNYDYPSPSEVGRKKTLAFPHWATEICCRDQQGKLGNGYDPTMASGLWLARTIYTDLVAGSYSAFDWWMAASPNLGCDPVSRPSCAGTPNTTGRNQALVYYDPHYARDRSYTLYLTKRYWVMKAFSRYVRPGSVLHTLRGLDTSTEAVSFVSGSQVVTVAINSGSTAEVLRVAPPNAQWSALAQGYQTDGNESWATVPVPVAPDGSSFTVELPPGSVTTVLSRISALTLLGISPP
jgi:O-glycosyl hydrolase